MLPGLHPRVLADPQQGGLGIAADGRLHRLAQSLQQARLRLHRRLASTAGATDTTAEGVPPAAQFGQAAADGAPRDTGRRRPCRYAAAPCRPRLARREQAPPRSSRNGAIASKRVRRPEITPQQPRYAGLQITPLPAPSLGLPTPLASIRLFGLKPLSKRDY